jgi:hypothetical protein
MESNRVWSAFQFDGQKKTRPFWDSSIGRVAYEVTLLNLAIAARMVQLSGFVISLYSATLCQMQRFGSVILKYTCQRQIGDSFVLYFKVTPQHLHGGRRRSTPTLGENTCLTSRDSNSRPPVLSESARCSSS